MGAVERVVSDLRRCPGPMYVVGYPSASEKGHHEHSGGARVRDTEQANGVVRLTDLVAYQAGSVVSHTLTPP
jgi:hypothetical protein